MNDSSEQESLLNQIELIESQPLDQRSSGFDQLAEQLLADLQSGDSEE